MNYQAFADTRPGKVEDSLIGAIDKKKKKEEQNFKCKGNGNCVKCPHCQKNKWKTRDRR